MRSVSQGGARLRKKVAQVSRLTPHLEISIEITEIAYKIDLVPSSPTSRLGNSEGLTTKGTKG